MQEAKQDARFLEVQRLFYEEGLGDPDLLEEWDGEDVEALREFLTEEEYQTLIDHLEDWEPDA